MTIYYIRKGQEGPIKIGYTAASAERRMKQLQTGQPEKLFLLGTSPGEIADERSIHVELDRYRVNGEWFEPKIELLAAIRNIIDNQHPWYFFRNARLNSFTEEAISREREELKALFLEFHREIDAKRALIRTELDELESRKKNERMIPQEVLVKEVTPLRKKIRELQELVEKQNKEIQILKGCMPTGVGVWAASREVARLAVSLNDNKRFGLDL